MTQRCPERAADYSGLRSYLNANPLQVFVGRADSRSRAFGCPAQRRCVGGPFTSACDRLYPRPPRPERSGRHVRILLGDGTIAETRAAWRVLETFHPPT